MWGVSEETNEVSVKLSLTCGTNQQRIASDESGVGKIRGKRIGSREMMGLEEA